MCIVPTKKVRPHCFHYSYDFESLSHVPTPNPFYRPLFEQKNGTWLLSNSSKPCAQSLNRITYVKFPPGGIFMLSKWDFRDPW